MGFPSSDSGSGSRFTDLIKILLRDAQTIYKAKREKSRTQNLIVLLRFCFSFQIFIYYAYGLISILVLVQFRKPNINFFVECAIYKAKKKRTQMVSFCPEFGSASKFYILWFWGNFCFGFGSSFSFVSLILL